MRCRQTVKKEEEKPVHLVRHSLEGLFPLRRGAAIGFPS